MKSLLDNFLFFFRIGFIVVDSYNNDDPLHPLVKKTRLFLAVVACSE